MILLQDGCSVRPSEVFKMQVQIGKQLFRRFNKLIHEIIIMITIYSLMAVSEIERIFQ